MAPIAVPAPVVTTTKRALPLITVVPMNTVLAASWGSVVTATGSSARFSTG